MIGDHIRSILPELQGQAESMMVTPCLVTRDGDPVLDPDTGELTVTGSVIFDGCCKIQTRDTEVRIVVVGSDDVVLQRYEIHVPVWSGPFQDGDLVAADNRAFRVQGMHRKTWQTAQRLPVIEEN